jgi:hypothetical protein
MHTLDLLLQEELQTHKTLLIFYVIIQIFTELKNMDQSLFILLQDYVL